MLQHSVVVEVVTPEWVYTVVIKLNFFFWLVREDVKD